MRKLRCGGLLAGADAIQEGLPQRTAGRFVGEQRPEGGGKVRIGNILAQLLQAFGRLRASELDGPVQLQEPELLFRLAALKVPEGVGEAGFEARVGYMGIPQLAEAVFEPGIEVDLVIADVPKFHQTNFLSVSAILFDFALSTG